MGAHQCKRRGRGTGQREHPYCRLVSADTTKRIAYDALVIKEGRVLLRVEHFQEGTRRITVVPATNLVDFVNEHERVLRTNALQGLDDLPREST